MNLGLGLAAADSYFKEGDARKVREYQQALRDSEMATLPEQTQARRSDYQDRIGLNSARATLRPGETQNAITRQQVDSVKTAGELGRVGREEQAKDFQADYGLNAAQFKLGRQGQEQKTQGMKLDMAEKSTQADDDQLSRKLIMAARQGLLDENSQRTIFNGVFAQKLKGRDKQSALDWANSVAKEEGIAPGTNGHSYTDITPVMPGQDQNMPGGGFYMVGTDASGKPVNIPFPDEKLTQDAQALKSNGKYLGIHNNQGDVFTLNEATGAFKQVYAGDKKLASKTHMGPLERDVNYLVDAHGMSKQQALSHLNSAKKLSRDQFVLKSLQDMAGMGKRATNDDIEAFGKLYDSAVSSKPQSNPSPKATLSNPSASTAARSLLGLP